MITETDYERITKGLIPEVETFIRTLSNNSKHICDGERITLLQSVVDLANGIGMGQGSWGPELTTFDYEGQAQKIHDALMKVYRLEFSDIPPQVNKLKLELGKLIKEL
jgi:hypothetical protein